MLNGRTVKSCCVLAADVAGHEITTIEALSSSATDLHPIQQAFVGNQGLQCGYCTPGVVMSALQLLEENQDPTPAEVRHAIAGNLCRCTGYQLIVKSVVEAARSSCASRPPRRLAAEAHAGRRATYVPTATRRGLGQAHGFRRPRPDAARGDAARPGRRRRSAA